MKTIKQSLFLVMALIIVSALLIKVNPKNTITIYTTTLIIYTILFIITIIRIYKKEL